MGYTLSLPESLCPTLLFSGVCLDPLSQMTPAARTPVHTRPKGRRRRAAGPAGASEAVLELGAPLLCCFSSMYLFSFSLLGPSPPAAGPHPCRGSRCRQKAIQGPIRTLHSRLETNPGTEEKEATGVGWRDQTWMETKTRTNVGPNQVQQKFREMRKAHVKRL